MEGITAEPFCGSMTDAADHLVGECVIDFNYLVKQKQLNKEEMKDMTVPCDIYCDLRPPMNKTCIRLHSVLEARGKAGDVFAQDFTRRRPRTERPYDSM